MHVRQVEYCGNRPLFELLRGTAKPGSSPPQPEVNVYVIVVGDGTRESPLLADLLARGASVIATSAAEVAELLGRETRRDQGQAADVMIRFERLSFHSREHRAKWAGQKLNLCERELNLLRTLVEEPGRAFSFEELQERVWSSRYFGDNTLVRMAIRRLRKKLKQQNVPLDVESVRGFGFRISVSPNGLVRS